MIAGIFLVLCLITAMLAVTLPAVRERDAGQGRTRHEQCLAEIDALERELHMGAYDDLAQRIAAAQPPVTQPSEPSPLSCVAHVPAVSWVSAHHAVSPVAVRRGHQQVTDLYRGHDFERGRCGGADWPHVAVPGCPRCVMCEQMLSVQEHPVPPEWVIELAKRQAGVPPARICAEERAGPVALNGVPDGRWWQEEQR